MKIVTMTGWGLRESIWEGLAWPTGTRLKNLSWQDWLPLSLAQRSAALRQAIEVQTDDKIKGENTWLTPSEDTSFSPRFSDKGFSNKEFSYKEQPKEPHREEHKEPNTTHINTSTVSQHNLAQQGDSSQGNSSQSDSLQSNSSRGNDFSKQLSEKNIQEQESVILLGCSLGAFLLHDAVLAMYEEAIPLPSKLKGVVLCALARSFVAAPANPYGSARAPLRAMRQRLKHAQKIATMTNNQTDLLKASPQEGPLEDPPNGTPEDSNSITQTLLREFARTCLSKDERADWSDDQITESFIEDPFSVCAELIEGLTFLEKVTLRDSHPTPQKKDSMPKPPLASLPFHLLAGTGDSIVRPEGTSQFAREQEYDYHVVEGAGHLLPVTRPEAILDCVKNICQRANEDREKE